MSFRALRLATGAVLVLAGAGRAARAQVGDVRDVPDPAIIKAGGAYYVFATGEGIPIRRSTDLVHWKRIGRVFPGATPSWAQRVIPGTIYPWAPDISFFAGRYHLYYALSTFGGQHSAIALATNVTLDPASPRYKWEDRGVVLESHPGVSTFNAIDPAAIVDEHGTPWLTWGSFWGGIKLHRLDAATGKLSTTDTTLYSLAARAGTDVTRGPRDDQAIEGPYIVRHHGWYYLFVSFDKCCEGARSNYNVRVGRSRTVTGPYVDRDSVPMTQGGGTLVLASYGVVRGPGHNSVLTDGDRSWIVHHYINANSGPASPNAPLAIPRSLEIRPLYWAYGDWPVAGEPLTPPAASGTPARAAPATPAPADPRQAGSPAGEWIDVTASLDTATTPVYAGDPSMTLAFVKDMRHGDALTLSSYSLGAHSGTHVDAPMHFIRGGASIDRVALDRLIGPARVIDIPDSVQAIDAAELGRHDWRGARRILFRTRSSTRGWMSSPAFHRDFAYITADAAQLLADAGVQLVGVDYLSAEQFGAAVPRAHQILLGKGIPIVEGLSLGAVPAGDYDLIVLPIKVAGHEAAPARAVLRKRGT